MTQTDLTSTTNKFRPFAVHRVNRPTESFTQISNKLIRSKIDAQAFRLLCFLLSHQDGFSMSWAHVEKEVLGIARHTRLRALGELEKLGYVAWVDPKRRDLLRVSDEPNAAVGEVYEVDMSTTVDVAGVTSADSARVGSAPHKNTTTTSKNTTNTYSEVPSASKQVLKTRKEDSGKPGPGSRPHASTIMSSDVDGAKTWMEGGLGHELDRQQDDFATLLLTTWESRKNPSWPGTIRMTYNILAKAEELGLSPFDLNDKELVAQAGGI